MGISDYKQTRLRLRLTHFHLHMNGTENWIKYPWISSLMGYVFYGSPYSNITTVIHEIWTPDNSLVKWLKGLSVQLNSNPSDPFSLNRRVHLVG